jgi:hypothetical protein
VTYASGQFQADVETNNQNGEYVNFASYKINSTGQLVRITANGNQVVATNYDAQ